MKIGFIGTGNMASAIISGLIGKEIFQPEEIIGADISEAGRERAKENTESVLLQTIRRRRRLKCLCSL